MFRSLELQELFKSPYDAGTAVLSIFPGAGGEDAEDGRGCLVSCMKIMPSGAGGK